METILNKITNILGKAFKECGYDFSYGKTTVSGRPDLCQFQCNGAMVGAKAYKKNPMQIANEAIDKMDRTLFEKVLTNDKWVVLRDGVYGQVVFKSFDS